MVSGTDYYERKFLPITNKEFKFEYTISSVQEECPKFSSETQNFKEAKAYSLFLQPQQPAQPYVWYEDVVQKSTRAMPLVRTLANVQKQRQIVWRETKSGDIEYKELATSRKLAEMRATEYEVHVDEVKVHQERLRHGGVYTLIVGTSNITITKMIEVTPPNSMNILWLIPQYVIMTLGEVMFSVTGLEFSYSQAPVTMKSVLQACWLLTVAFGNVIVVIVAELKFFDSQANEFFLFAGLMFVDMLLFMWMAHRYQPNNPVTTMHKVEESSNRNLNITPVRRYDLPKYSKNIEEE